MSEQMSKERFREFRDEIANLLEKASQEGGDPENICAAALNAAFNHSGWSFRVESRLLQSSPDSNRPRYNSL